MSTFKSFDGVQIASLDEGEGPAVILLHGCGVDGLGQVGNFERGGHLLVESMNGALSKGGRSYVCCRSARNGHSASIRRIPGASR